MTLGDANGPVSAPGNTFYLSSPGSTSTAAAGPYVFSGTSGNTLTGISPDGVAFAGQLAFQPVPLTFTVALCNLADSISVDQCFQHQITSGRTTTLQFTTNDGVSGNPPHVPVISGQDYVAKCSVTSATCSGPVSAPITISPGQSTATMSVSVISNTVQQDAVRWFFLKLVSATNASIGWGLGTGDIIDDDAANPPIATTGNPSAIGTGQATVAATVNPKGEATRAYIEYGTTTSYGKQTPAQTLPIDGADHQLSFNITGLLAGTTYHYRVVATHDATHATGYGDDKTFTTSSPPPPAPTAKTGLAKPVGDHTATIGGVVNPHGTATTAYLEYGKTAKYGLRTTAIDVGAGVADKSVTFELKGLAAKTIYHYRVVAARGGAATAYGDDVTFKTKPVQEPMRVSLGSRKPVTVTAKGFVPLTLRCTGNVQKRCLGSVFLGVGTRAAGQQSFKLLPNRQTIVRVRLRPSVLNLLRRKKSLILGVTITTSAGADGVNIVTSSLKILAPDTQQRPQMAPTGSVVQCKTRSTRTGRSMSPRCETSPVRRPDGSSAATSGRARACRSGRLADTSARPPGAASSATRSAAPRASASTESSSRTERNALCPAGVRFDFLTLSREGRLTIEPGTRQGSPSAGLGLASRCRPRLRRGWDSNPRAPFRAPAVFKTAPFVRLAPRRLAQSRRGAELRQDLGDGDRAGLVLEVLHQRDQPAGGHRGAVQRVHWLELARCAGSGRRAVAPGSRSCSTSTRSRGSAAGRVTTLRCRTSSSPTRRGRPPRC